MWAGTAAAGWWRVRGLKAVGEYAVAEVGAAGGTKA